MNYVWTTTLLTILNMETHLCLEIKFFPNKSQPTQLLRNIPVVLPSLPYQSKYKVNRSRGFYVMMGLPDTDTNRNH